MPGDPFGSSLSSLLLADLRDRVGGRRGRANARWGLLKPPAPGGKLVWIAAGADRDSVRLAVELARALREKRLDLRLALTVEREYADVLRPLEDMPLAGWGYAPCDRPAAVRRALARRAPLGLICAGRAPRANLARESGIVRHRLVVGAPAPADAAFEQTYPAADDQTAGDAATRAPAANLLTLVMPAQLDPNFAALATGGAERRLWWWHGDAGGLARFLPRFRDAFAADPLFVTGAAADDGHSTARLSDWQREPLPAAAVVAVDAPQWLPAIAAACTGAHFAMRDDAALWQALAGGAAVSLGAEVGLPKATLAGATERCGDADAVMGAWRRIAGSPAEARARRDAGRRAFWDERRLAAAVSDELLARVFDWD
ncbi:MAG TPA: hypothetical protein VLW45_02100 [Pelomicrobium sp.]|nr:hypothetical protein [Pelomicrobium sp.]